MGRRPPRFTQSETKQMETLLLEAKDESLDQNFYESLAQKINLASARKGKRAIHWTQVHRWAQRKQKVDTIRNPSDRLTINDLGIDSEACPINIPDSIMKFLKGQRDPQIHELEARSNKDGAWYDVETFVTQRFLGSGEMEVLVRYQDFGAEEDEWLAVKEAIRERSVPIESDECHRVAVGDLVVCFRENSDKACYFDAHIVEIRRRTHDIRGCRCRFLIKYGNDQTMETVHLGRLCRRP